MYIFVNEQRRSDGYCNYCNMSRYRETYDSRLFYEITGSNMQTVVSACEYCVRELFTQLLPVAYPEIATAVTTVIEMPIEVRVAVIEEVESFVNRIDY